jgi:hypothetical protein
MRKRFCGCTAKSLPLAAGKLEITDSLTFLATTTAQHSSMSAPSSDSDVAPITIFSRPFFHPAFTISGAQPSVLVPQPSGDLLRFSIPCAGRLLFAGPRPLGHSLVSTSAACSPAAQSRILPAQKPSAMVPPSAQRLYRGHAHHIVATGRLPDNGGLVTVDMSGMIAAWPLTDDQSSGLGWFEPRKLVQLPQMFQALQLVGLPRWRDVGDDENLVENAAGTHFSYQLCLASCWFVVACSITGQVYVLLLERTHVATSVKALVCQACFCAQNKK